MLKGFEVTAEDLKEHIHRHDPLQLVELRHHHQHDWGLFKARDSLRVEYDAVEQHLAEIPRDRPIVVFADCPGEETSARAAKLLLNRGWHDVHKLAGGFDAYLEAGLPVEPLSREVSAARIMLL